MLTSWDRVLLCLDLLGRGRWEGVGCHGITLQLNCICKFCVESNQGSVGVLSVKTPVFKVKTA